MATGYLPLLNDPEVTMPPQRQTVAGVVDIAVPAAAAAAVAAADSEPDAAD